MRGIAIAFVTTLLFVPVAVSAAPAPRTADSNGVLPATLSA